MSAPIVAFRHARTVISLALASLAGLLIAFFVLIHLGHQQTPAPVRMRPPEGRVEAEFVRRMAKQGHEVAFYEDSQVAVLVSEQQWRTLGAVRFGRYRFLADTKAELVRVQARFGDKALYRLTIKSSPAQRLLAEETDFNPVIND